MSSSEPPIRVVQCPKCGSPVQGVSAGDIASCSYCGATLQVSAGASGHPVAKLANIEASTSYLARTEALKRLRGQLAAHDEALDALWETHHAKKHEARSTTKGQGGCWLLLGLLVIIVVMVGEPFVAIVFVLPALLLVIAVTISNKKRAGKLTQEADAILQDGLAARAERDRLAQRIAQLEAGLDDLANQL